ncbi:serine C-palmitoyltransferase [Naematelia encephala]|uniref:serine C-palmitoyltransferase n=1 Tax=Naematelia encephala TaxID=71784 RepID=A0A1Y2BNZ7_9TREE|nr:serine C-palmitoyltransferase [Naematelia encephala]
MSDVPLRSQSSTTEIPTPLLPLLSILSSAFLFVQDRFRRIPGSPIIVRYIQSSYQDDPYRSLLEVLLLAFALRTLLKGRTREEGSGKNFIKLTEKEIDDLVDEWQPVPLIDAPGEIDEETLDSIPTIYGPNGIKIKLSPGGKPVLNMATPNWTGMMENEKMKEVAITTLRSYGVGTCGPAGFYGYLDVHMRFEAEVAAFLGVEACIMYSQGFAAISSVIPAFAKRGDIIVADRGVNFAIQKGLQISRSQIRFYAHGDMKDLERVLQQVEREQKRKGSKLTKKFIVAEGVFENDGMMLDLPKVCELKKKYKYRLILDETQSFGMIGKHGRGVTEFYNFPAKEVDMIVGSMATSLATGGGFCAGSEVVCQHQRINSSASVFSASLPALLATASSTAVSLLQSNPSLLTSLATNIAAFRHHLSKIEPVSIPEQDSNSSPSSQANKDAIIHVPSHPSSALIHIFLLNPPDTMEAEERLLQEVVDELLSTSGVLITRARRLRGQEQFEPEPSLKVCISGAMSKKDVEKAAQGLRSALIKVAGKKR